MLHLDLQGGECEGGVELLLRAPFVEPLCLDQLFERADVREGLQVLARVDVVQRGLLLVSGAEDHLAVVRREATAAAAPHLRGQDPRDVGPWRLRRPSCCLSLASKEREALLIV